jgi:riboflavin kinase/FMN adenylyltransferase
MNVIRAAGEWQPGSRPVCIAIGMFDGVHLGHQQVLRRCLEEARQVEGWAVAVTFDAHPNAVVAPERNPRLIYALSQKLRVLESLGLEVTLLLRFDRAFSQVPAEDFIRTLARDLRLLRSVSVGSSFAFGHRRSGHLALLRRLGQELGFRVNGLAAVALAGKVVSSTRIREAIQAGHLDAASQMLGRRYALCGRVIPGDGLGRQLGFPTANLDVASLVLPPPGVYAAWARVGELQHRAVLNLGVRPTLPGPAPATRLEVHLLDLDADLYGQELEVTFGPRLRAEQRFPSLPALRDQIQRDVQAARTALQ